MKEKAEILNLQSRVVFFKELKKKMIFFFSFIANHFTRLLLKEALYFHTELKQPVYRTRKLQGLGAGCSSILLLKLPICFRVSVTMCFFSLGQILQWQLRRKLIKTKQILN